MTENIIKGFLMHKDLSGYDIKLFVEKSTNHFYTISFGSIYPALQRLEKKEEIAFKEEQVGKKTKKIYTLLPKGKESFMVWLSSPITIEEGKMNHLIKLFFFNFLPKNLAIQILSDFINVLINKLSDISNIKDDKQGEINIFPNSTIMFGLEYFSMSIKFYEKLLKQI